MAKPPTLLVLSVIAPLIALVGISRVTGQTQGENAERQATANSSSLEQRNCAGDCLDQRLESPSFAVADEAHDRRLPQTSQSPFHPGSPTPSKPTAFLMEPLPKVQKDYASVLSNLGSLYL